MPLVESNAYRRQWFLLSMATSPLFIVAYLHLFSWPALLGALCAGALLCAAGHLGTRSLKEGEAPEWSCGTAYPLGACCGPAPLERCWAAVGSAGAHTRSHTRLPPLPPFTPTAGAAAVAVYAFALAAMWISLFADEIVGLLQFFGLLRWGACLFPAPAAILLSCFRRRLACSRAAHASESPSLLTLASPTALDAALQQGGPRDTGRHGAGLGQQPHGLREQHGHGGAVARCASTDRRCPSILSMPAAQLAPVCSSRASANTHSSSLPAQTLDAPS